MARKQDKSKADAPNADTIWAFLSSVERDYELPRYSDSSVGVELGALKHEIETLEGERDERLEQFKNEDKRMLILKTKIQELKGELKQRSIEMLKRIAKIRRAINVHGLTPKIIEQVQALEAELAAK